MRRFAVLFVYYTISFVEGTRYIISRFVADPSFDRLVPEKDILRSVQSASPILCCAICKGNSSCLSAFYNNDNKTCTLYRKVFNATETGSTSETGSKYYYYTDETNNTTTPNVVTTSKTLQTATVVSSPGSQGGKMFNLTDQNSSSLFEILPVFFGLSVRKCIGACLPEVCHLVWIDSSEENEQVRRIVQASQYQVDCFYIGHITTRNEVRYFDSTNPKLPTVPTFEAKFLYFNASLDCIAIQASGNWTSVDCETPRPSICEFEKNFTTQG